MEVSVYIPVKVFDSSRRFCRDAVVSTAQYTFKQLLEAGAKPFPSLWHDGRLVASRVARFCSERGHPVSQATLSRHLTAKHGSIDDITVDALEAVLRIPRAMLRNEPLTPRMEELLKRYPLEVILLAEQLNSLPPEEFGPIASFIEQASKRVAAQKTPPPSPTIDKLRK